jgi:hypothetical protein
VNVVKEATFMDMIKNILGEELEDAEALIKHYQENLSKLPKGSLSVKNINGREYIYLQYREGGKVVSKSLEKLSEKEKKKLQNDISQRKKLERLIKETKQKIEYLKKALNIGQRQETA